jgi:GAF domain-containing protein
MIDRGPRFYSSIGLTAVAVVIATLSGILAGTSHGTARVGWITVDLVSVATAAVVQTVEQHRRERERRAAEIVAVDMRVAMNDALDPIVRQLGRIAVAGGRRERDELREQTIPMVLYSASLLIGPERVRACWFRLHEGRGPRRLVPELSEGRADVLRTEYVEGTSSGDAVFELLIRNTHRFCRDVATAPPPGWDPSHVHEYRTFIAVPVVAGTTAFGLLTVDSLLPGDLTEGDVPLLRLLAGLLADALAYGS